VAQAADTLVAERLLLREDADRMSAAAHSLPSRSQSTPVG
jgi:hypothetical protein